MLCSHPLRHQKSVGVNYSLLFMLGLIIVPCVVETRFTTRSHSGHSPEKKKNQFMPMQDFLLSLVTPTTAHPHPQACSCIACLTLERDITSLGYFPSAFIFQPTTGRVHKVSISRKMFLFPTLGFSPKTAN